MPTESEIRAAFRLFDKDGSGTLSPDELKAILTRDLHHVAPVRSSWMGAAPFNEAQIDAFVKEHDTNGDGALSMDEFSRAWATLNKDQTMERLLALLDTDGNMMKALDFEMSTPMLVMPLSIFKQQGRICKSTKAWRDEALRKGWLVAHVTAAGDKPPAPGKVVFISHT